MFTETRFSTISAAAPTTMTGKLTVKLRNMSWILLILIGAVAVFGFALLYSAAGGNWDPWASRQAVRFLAGLFVLVVVALIDIRFWMAVAYPAYLAALVMLIAVEFIGVTGMGAQRWLDVGPFVVQPSEFMKITMVLALARYLHGMEPDEVSSPLKLLGGLMIIMAPVGLVLKQPDLGTSVLLMAGGCGVLFMAGLSWRVTIAGVIAGLVAAAVGWRFLKPYQQQRVLTFLDPESDPMGAGYHILQSKIAIGSGGLFGKGFLEGTQSHLNFLPEKQTDFIFTALAEELGLVGGLVLLGLYLLILGTGMVIALTCKHHFGRLVTVGVLMTFFLYILINTSMVMGLIPVVGVPLPLVSYGGTAMMTLMFGFGLVMCVRVHKDMDLPRNPMAL